MTNITINDLSESKELDKKALTSIHGGIALLLPAVQQAREAFRKIHRFGGPQTLQIKKHGQVEVFFQGPQIGA